MIEISASPVANSLTHADPFRLAGVSGGTRLLANDGCS